MRRFTPFIALATILAITACNNEEPDPGPDPGPTPMMWLVGTGGTMLRFADDEISGYPLGLGSDLRAIDCRGATDAFAVGDDGVVLSTFDGGEHWNHLDLGPDVDFTSIAAAHEDVVWAVGDAVAFFSIDSGASWEEVADVADSLTSVATTDDGQLAYATASSGAILRFELGRGYEVVREPDGRALFGVSVSELGESILAVGDAGTAIRSDDYGYRFDDVASGTDLRLRAVRLRGDAGAAIAVGDEGVVVRWGFTPTVDVGHAITDGRSLAAVHASASGVVGAVGDAGAAVLSWDFGASFEARDLGTSVDLTGMDDLRLGEHF